MIQVHHATYETLFSEKRRGVGWPSGRGVVSTGPGRTPGTKMSEMVGTVKGRKTSSQRKCVGEAQGHGRAGGRGGGTDELTSRSPRRQVSQCRPCSSIGWRTRVQAQGSCICSSRVRESAVMFKALTV